VADLTREEALATAKMWRRERLAVWWTDSKEGDGAKRCSSSWNTKAVRSDTLEAGALAGSIANRTKRKNPVLVAKASNLILIDCDSPEDVARFKSFGPPPTLSVRTRQGRHFYYRPDEGMSPGGVYFEAGAVTPKADCYLVMPPALHPSGHVYVYENENGINVLPASVHRAMIGEASSQARATDDRLEDDGEVVAKGERHAWLARKVGALANVAISQAWLVEQALALNAQKCDPPKPEAEVRSMAKAFWKDRKSKVDTMTRVEEESRRDRAINQHRDNPPPPTLGAVDDLDDGPPQETRWFKNFEMIIPVGFHVALVAPGGTGKGLFTMLLAANMSDGPLLYSGSEDNRNLLKMRIQAAGVRKGAFKRVRVPLDDGHDRQLSFPSDVEFLERLIVETGAKVFVYDAGPAHLDAGLKNDKVEDVRSAVDRLSEVCDRTGCTIIAILHPGKSKEVSARDLALGSKAWIDSVRHGLFMVEDDEEDGIVHLEVTKTNIGEKGYGWMMAIREKLVDALDPDGAPTKTMAGYVVKLGRSLKSVDVILGRDGKQKAAMKWILGYLATREPMGSPPRRRAQSDALKAMVIEEVDCRERTVRRAIEALTRHGKVEVVKEGFGPGTEDDPAHWFTVLIEHGDDDILGPADGGGGDDGEVEDW
jgi:hypothetical protein